MKLTREEVAGIRSWYDAQTARGIYPYDTGKLLDFAEQMWPVCDALMKVMAAEALSKGYIAANKAFWKLARELAETGAKQ